MAKVLVHVLVLISRCCLLQAEQSQQPPWHLTMALSTAAPFDAAAAWNPGQHHAFIKDKDCEDQRLNLSNSPRPMASY
eukprot:6469906-Amphidinium_carterae.2